MHLHMRTKSSNVVCLTNYSGNFFIELLLGFWVMKKAEYTPSQGTRGSFCSCHKQVPHKLYQLLFLKKIKYSCIYFNFKTFSRYIEIKLLL